MDGGDCNCAQSQWIEYFLMSIAAGYRAKLYLRMFDDEIPAWMSFRLATGR